MALLNPPELRPSVLLLIANDLGSRRGQREKQERLLASLAPSGLGGADPDRDVRLNLQAAVDLGVARRDGDYVHLEPDMYKAVSGGSVAMVSLLRARVLDPAQNVAAWGSQSGARDLTNALSWFLSFPAGRGPIGMEGGVRSAKDLQERDFGPRQAEVGDDDASGWPIGNPTRWQCFRRWACALGFAWVTPKGTLAADPTQAVREALSAVFENERELSAQVFVRRLAARLPVLHGGSYRQFVEANWRRPVDAGGRIDEPLSDALERLRSARRLAFDDRADSPRVARFDGTTFSHVSLGIAT